MATSTDVSIPKRLDPVFPDLCVVCECTPDSTAKINTNSQNPLTVFFFPILYAFGWSRVEFPICQDCKPRFYFQRWGRTTVCWTILILAVFLLMPYFDDWDRLTRRIAVGAIALLVCLPYFIFEVFVPRSFDVTSGNAATSYEFASRRYGIEFYGKNSAEHPAANIKIEIG